MKGVRWFFVFALAGVAIIWIVVERSRPADPVYQGHRLSWWLDKWEDSHFVPTTPEAAAIRSIGSNGVPLLMSRVSFKRSSSEIKFWRMAAQVRPQSDPIPDDSMRAVGAGMALNLLGEGALPAYPALTNLFLSTNAMIPAGIALAGMGHEGIGVLMQALTNQDWRIRLLAVSGLEHARSDFEAIVPALLIIMQSRGTNQGDSLVIRNAQIALGKLHKDPEQVVPAFITLLNNPDSYTRWNAAIGLGRFGPEAKAAVSALQNALNDSDTGSEMSRRKR
jgi:hypothetical protein